MHREIPFEPYSLVPNAFYQTVLSVALTFGSEPPSERRLVSLPDGDKIALEIATPPGWKETDLSVVIVHGLCGSHKSPNPLRLAKQLYERGVRSVRFNMRGCGSGRGLSKNFFHCGRSEDLFEALKAVRLEHPRSPTVLVGFSLGGNIVLKLAGELGSLAKPFFKRVVAVSPPVDLSASIERFGQPENAFFERYFYKLLRKEVHYRHRTFKDLPRVHLPRELKLYEFDQVYTVPMGGFKSAEDYYYKCSAMHVAEEIRTPCKILFAEDDPIISPSSLDSLVLPDYVEIYKTKKGGHLGYLGKPSKGKGVHWLDPILLDWVVDG